MNRQIFVREVSLSLYSKKLTFQDREQEPRYGGGGGYRGGFNAGGYGGYPRGGGYTSGGSFHGDTTGRQVYIGNVCSLARFCFY